jgi:hypothetical protein
MPGINPTGIAFAQELRVAFQYSRFIDELSKSIASDGTYQSSNNTFRDPTYIVKDKEGNIKRYWRSPQDAARQAKYEKYMRILLEGLDFLKPQWYQARQYTDTSHQAVYQGYNFLTLISEAFADLTCGGGVEIKTGIESIDKLLTEQLRFEDKIYEWIFEASVFEFVGVQVVTHDDSGVLEIQRVLPHFLYPMFPKNKENEPVCISKKVWMQKEDISEWQQIRPENTSDKIDLNGVKFDGFVFEERHFKGMVENYLWAVHGNQIVTRVDLKFYDPNLDAVSLTGLPDFAIKLIPNKVMVGKFISDWDNIIDINLNFNDRASRAGDLLNQYAEPQLVINDSQATYDPATGKVHYRRPRGGVIMMRPQDRHQPNFMQPGVDTAGTENNLKFLLDMLSTHSQAAAVLLNPEAQGNIESGVAYKLKLTPTLKKIARRKTQQEIAVKGLILNILAAINFYHDKELITRELEERVNSSDDMTMRTRCEDALAKINQGSVLISLESFDDYFSKLDVFNDNPYGIFISDPAQATTGDQLQYLADGDLLTAIENKRTEVMEYLRLDDIQVEMTPSMPQDIAQALERLGGQKSMSLKRYLMEFDGFTEEQAEEEIQRIMDEDREVMAQGISDSSVMLNPRGGLQQAILDFGQTDHQHEVLLDAEGNGISERAPDGHNHRVLNGQALMEMGHTHPVVFQQEQNTQPEPMMAGAGMAPSNQNVGAAGMSPGAPSQTNLQSTAIAAGTTPQPVGGFR